MADTKISAMPAATALTGAEIFPIVQGGINAQTPLSAIRSFGNAYGGWQSNVTQTGSISAGTLMTVNITDISDGITANANAFTVPNTGTYNIQFSSQFTNTESTQEDVAIWAKIDGTDVAGSAGIVTVAGRKNPATPGKTITSWNYYLDLTANQYVQLAWQPTSANVTMDAVAASATYPAAAAVIITMNQVA
jgi:hypothetical protein